MNTKKQMPQQALIEVIFDGRNKDFGAYQLRKKYNERMFLAFFFSSSLMILAVLAPQIKSYLFPREIDPVIDIPQPVVCELLPIDLPTITPPEGGTPKLAMGSTEKTNDSQNDEFISPEVTDDPLDEIPPTDDIENTSSDPSGGKEDGTLDGTGGNGGGNTTNIGSPFGSEDGNSDEIIDMSEDFPSFPGGEKGLKDYLRNNLNYPKLARDYNVTGRVVIEFVIEKDGSIGNVKVLESKGFGLDEEGIRVVKSMPQWNPGTLNQKPARFRYRLPIVFTLR